MRNYLRKLPLSSKVAGGYLLIILFLAVFGPWLGFQDPDLQDYSAVMVSPNGDHWLGTDDLGRDTLARTVAAARISVIAVVESVGIAVVIGVTFGILAGLIGGWFDSICSRLTDVLLSFPPLILAIGLVGVMGPSLSNAMIAVGILFVPVLYRVTRQATLVVAQEGFVDAAKVSGASVWFMIRRHVFKNVLPPIITQICLLASTAMIAEASLSFIGLGVQPPDASWGSMLGRAAKNLTSDSIWLMLFPGLAIAITALAYLVLGDGIREIAQSRYSHASEEETTPV